ncbi:MAG: hypothetical protein AAFV45_11970 [Pseudomonadota bacterium]
MVILHVARQRSLMLYGFGVFAHTSKAAKASHPFNEGVEGWKHMVAADLAEF